jgi:hypothetical protein
MTKSKTPKDLQQEYGTLCLFADAIGSPLYRAERMEFLNALICACEAMSADLEPYAEKACEMRAAPYQWRMDDQAFTPIPVPI